MAPPVVAGESVLDRGVKSKVVRPPPIATCGNAIFSLFPYNLKKMTKVTFR